MNNVIIITIFLLFFSILISSDQIKINDDHIQTNEGIVSEDICNQEIIAKDWGFTKLYETFISGKNETYEYNMTLVQSPEWLMIYSDQLSVSFVTSLKEDFFTTDIVGYYAIRIQSSGTGYSDNEAMFTLNETLHTYHNSAYFLTFTISTTLANFEMDIVFNGNSFKQIEPSDNTFDRIPYEFFIDSSVFTNPTTSFAITINYDFQAIIPVVYVENIRFTRVPYQQIPIVYVSSKGSDITGMGTIEQPFSSIQQAIQFADVFESSKIILEPGFYCGMGNSYIDASSIENLEIISHPYAGNDGSDYGSGSGDISGAKSIISGEGKLIQVQFTSVMEFGVANNITFYNLVFINSSTRAGGHSIGIDGNCSLRFVNCDFIDHYGDSVVSINYLDYAIFYNTTFSRHSQYAIQSIGVFSIYSLLIENCIFNCINSLNLLNINEVLINNSTFTYDKNENTDTGQCPILLDMIKVMVLEMSTINTAVCVYRTYITASFLSFYGQPKNIFTLSSFLALNTNTSMDNSYFTHNGNVSSSLSAFEGYLKLKDTIFNNTFSTSSIQVEGAQINFKNVSFLNEANALLCSGSNGKLHHIQMENTGSLMTLTKSNLLIYNSTFIGNTDPNEVVKSTLLTMGCIFLGCKYTLFDIITSTYEDNGSIFENNAYGFLSTDGPTNIKLNGTQFSRNMAPSLITLNELAQVLITDCTFSDNFCSDVGGIVKMEGNCSTIIESSLFLNNSGVSGGVAYIGASSSLELNNVNAYGNIAYKDGGVVCLDSSSGSLLINGGNFFNNTANLGSFVYYYGNSMNIQNATYGSDQTVVLGQVFMNVSTNIVSNVQSGGTYQINITFVNNKHRPVSGYRFDKTKKLFIALGSVVMFSIDFPNDAYLVIPPFQLVGTLNSNQTIYISSDASTVTSNKIQFNFEQCYSGYYPNEQNTLCIPCPYSTVGTNGLGCEICPQNAVCFGANNIAGMDGYWIDYNSSLSDVYQCPSGVCFLNSTNFNTSCADYSTGVLCASCVEGYYNCGSGCKKETSINKLVLATKIITFIVLVVAQQLSSDNSGLVTIALYFLQTLVVISSGIKFSILNLFSGATSSHAGKSDGVLSFLNDCIGPYDFYWNHYFVILQPAFLLLILAIIILLEFSLRKTKIIFKIPLVKNIIETSDKEFRNRQFSAFVKVCMNSYGPFATEVLLILFCNQVGTHYLLNANPEVQCDTNQFYQARTVTCCLLTVLGIFPIIIFVLLYRHRHRLNDKDIERKLGVFYLKYIPKLYFWDVTLLVKRLSIVTISLLPFDSKLRSISLVTLGLLFLFIHLKFQPFISDQDNNLETVSLVLLFISCIYLDNGLYQDTEQYILIICILVFVAGAIKFQSKYLVNEFNTSVYPIIKTIWNKIFAKTSNNSDDNENNEYKVVYNTYGDEEEINKDQQYSYDSMRNIVKEVDKKGIFYNFEKNDQAQISTSYSYDDDDDDDLIDVFGNSIKRRN
ncbi:hypothetical protein RB653_000940 [Dictyostelium firmibasis]|uniref:Uncharacterized protein n=1 Tax=Dictyostelium firmibasis TaxID=79012 RepID=A0AAN7U3J1_9MYCE